MPSTPRTGRRANAAAAIRRPIVLALLDPAAGSDNVGDEFIVEAIERRLAAIFPHGRQLRVPTHHPIGALGRKMLASAAHRIVAGSNLLPSRIGTQSQWAAGPRDAQALAGLVCLGVGWQSVEPPDAATQDFLKAVLDPECLHSAREPLTAERLRALGLHAEMTGCPTMWGLTPEHCAAIPATRSAEVVLTLSTPAMDPVLDGALIALLRRRYEWIWFFPQHWGDASALQPHDLSRITFVPPRRGAYDRLLRSRAIDYVGLRLHGGIRALQHGRRALILATDHRATGMATGTGLPVTDRADLDAVAAWIDGDRPTRITLPTAAIAAWSDQFAA